jgi:RHH-type proline utilization regulon transcriptional repressor/proline dehydrogenase/delta 1-pyrroline-5-carboxylate dehydrogenase
MTAVLGQTRPTLDPLVLEGRSREIGRALLGRIGRGDGPWSRTWWDNKLMGLTMGTPQAKVQLFRFIDALPTLSDPASVRRHLTEYLEEAGDQVPAWLRMPLGLAPKGSFGDGMVAAIARWGATRMAGRFIAGSTPVEALETVKLLRKRKLAFTADLLGEAIISDREADAYQQTCLNLLRGLAGPLDQAPEVPLIDRDDHGPIPRVNLSLKLTSLVTWFDALHPDATSERVLERLRPILRLARELGGFINVDMEQYAYKDLTFAIFKAVLDEPEFRDWPNAGIVVQAYLPAALADLEMLRDWARRRGTPVTIRLVKGAYWDYEVLHAQQVGWPIPVYQEKWATDANYERCARFLLENHETLQPAFGSHNVRSLASAQATAEALGVPARGYEIQMLYGMAQSAEKALVAEERRVRLYTPYGAMLPGMAYLVRRLLENTSNDSFLKASSARGLSFEDLLRDPKETGSMWARKRRLKSHPAAMGSLPPFRNEPPTDFTRPEAREAMQMALAAVRSRLGRDYDLNIAGTPVITTERLESLDPGNIRSVVGRTGRATAAHADSAVTAARRAFDDWSSTPVEERAAVLVRAAGIMRRRRFDLAAWEVYECGKPWREADADVAEAIDFCEFYAREMIRLGATRHRDVPGETNAIEHLPRGVAVVIPPWNFPLAIPTGMTTAALVAGNTVILKPAEQSPVIAWQLFQVLQEAGLPPDVLSFLPGIGEEVGQALVDDPRVDLIAFTGSRKVGLEINRRAAEPKPGQDHVKRVIAEMGGKNAIIIDDDADLDEAVLGVIYSAFGYAGQKCSACSRVIVLEAVHDAFVSRLTEATRSVPVGQADRPETLVGPIIDGKACERILNYARIAETEGKVLVACDLQQLEEQGNFVAPRIVLGVSPEARIAQEEIFGPILAVLKARDLDDALEIGNGTEYALTGGLYSRSPANIARIKREFRVGNLYINRPITGALVGRQPFGGFRMSGIGTKAGGSDYLLEFLLSRTVTENTQRRGFAPELDQEIPVPAESGL